MTKMVKPDDLSARLTPGTQYDKHVADTHAGMAFFAGTGPSRRSCQTCGEFRAVLSRSQKGVMTRRGRCARAKRSNGGKWMQLFPAGAKACKYYEQIEEHSGRKVLAAGDTTEELFVEGAQFDDQPPQVNTGYVRPIGGFTGRRGG